MKKTTFFFLLFFLFFIKGYSVSPVNHNLVVYTSQDSLMVEQFLREASLLPANENRVLFYARKFLKTPYVASTLEVCDDEKLVVNLRELDCTTFVETVLALCLAEQSQSPNFDAFISSLCSLRYRGGKLDGYSSRLHYFSDWIDDNVCLGHVEEIEVGHLPCSKVQILCTNYMSKHPDKYKQMLHDSTNVAQIIECEKRLIGKRVYYLPKHVLNGGASDLPIRDGDVLAFTTNIDGLDISHVGFAVWMEDGALHLFHASMKSKKVILDTQTLFNYSHNIKKHTGIRVLRLRNEY